MAKLELEAKNRAWDLINNDRPAIKPDMKEELAELERKYDSLRDIDSDAKWSKGHGTYYSPDRAIQTRVDISGRKLGAE